MGGVVKKIRKIIPKEVRPAVPFAAAYFGGPALGAKLGIQSALGQKIAGKALTAALASKAQGDDTSAALRSAALAASPDILSGGLGKLSTTAAKAGIEGASPALTDTAGKLLRASRAIEGAGALKTVGAQSAIEGSAQLAEIQQDQIDAYNRQLQEQGLMDKTKRRQSIFNIYMNAGYDADYVNSVLDKYGYADGGEVEEEMSEVSLSPGKGKMTEIEKTLYAKEEGGDKSEGIMKARRAKRKKDDDEGDLASGLMAAADGVQKAFGRGFGNVEPVPMLRFAKGGEVVEEVEESGIMTASVPGPFDDYDDIAMQLFGKGYKDLTPEEMELMQEELERLMNKFRSRKDDQGIMQMASGYKSDIEEMYEQYVFEMEEMGLQPMSFSQFLARERAGMKDGGKAQRRKKGEPADEIIETEQEIFLDKMPRPRRREGIMEAADGGIMEKDMRGGGFIPEGSKERADDVPARLSKNEFVMTADAVRAAGGGSVNKGAKRMYDLMYSLEGKI